MVEIIPKLKLNNGFEIPVLGLAVSVADTRQEIDVREIVEEAIDLGYRLFQCDYSSERKVGEALNNKMARGEVQREDLFVICTFPTTTNIPLEASIVSSLISLQLTFVDLYLISDLFADYANLWKAAEQVYRKKLTRAIAVSDLNCKQIDEILNICTVMPQVNQVVCQDLGKQRDLRKYCECKGIAVVSRSEDVIGLDVISYGRIAEIAHRYEKSVEQVVLKCSLQLGIVVLKTVENVNVLKDNLKVFDFWLAPEDVSLLSRS